MNATFFATRFARRSKVQALYEAVRGAPEASGSDRSMACYRLGRRELQQERMNGQLKELWR